MLSVFARTHAASITLQKLFVPNVNIVGCKLRRCSISRFALKVWFIYFDIDHFNQYIFFGFFFKFIKVIQHQTIYILCSKYKTKHLTKHNKTRLQWNNINVPDHNYNVKWYSKIIYRCIEIDNIFWLKMMHFIKNEKGREDNNNICG